MTSDASDPSLFPWKRFVLFLGVCLGLIHFFAQQHPLDRHSVFEDPQQEPLFDGKPWVARGYQLTPLAKYKIRARVIHRERYHFGRESDLSPMDFAVGWGVMSNPTVYPAFHITQSNRWYHWEGSPVLPNDQIISHSANMHLIPADAATLRQLKEVQAGDLITLEGYLVEVHSADGFHWSSSLSRTDTGNHSCELMWVEHVTGG